MVRYASAGVNSGAIGVVYAAFFAPRKDQAIFRACLWGYVKDANLVEHWEDCGQKTVLT